MAAQILDSATVGPYFKVLTRDVDPNIQFTAEWNFYSHDEKRWKFGFAQTLVPRTSTSSPIATALIGWIQLEAEGVPKHYFDPGTLLVMATLSDGIIEALP